MRSLLTLKALTYEPTGGLVAAPTTSLPEWLGGVRNWDYRYCWLRDAALTLDALMAAGYVDEAAAWRDWLLRAVAGDPDDLQIMYGVAGERRLAEYELALARRLRGLAPGACRQRGRPGSCSSTSTARSLDAMYVARSSACPTPPPGASSCLRHGLARVDTGASPTTASGRCAAHGASSSTRR